MLAVVVLNGTSAASRAGSSAARNSAASAVTTVCGFRPGNWLRATYRTRSPVISRQIRNPRNSSRKPASSPGPSSLADRKSTRLNSSHDQISYAVLCLKKKKDQEPYADIDNEILHAGDGLTDQERM